MSAEVEETSSGAAPGKASANGVRHDVDKVAAPGTATRAPVAADIEALRTRLHETLGQAVLAMSALPRYRDQTLGDLRALLVEPLLRDRVLIAKAAATPPSDTAAPPPQAASLVGIAIWASVSDEVDARIREQVKARVFPVKLKAEDWASGEKAWLLDVIAPNTQLASAVLTGFAKRIAKGDLAKGELNVHPVAAKQVDAGLLERAGATR